MTFISLFTCAYVDVQIAIRIAAFTIVMQVARKSVQWLFSYVLWAFDRVSEAQIKLRPFHKLIAIPSTSWSPV